MRDHEGIAGEFEQGILERAQGFDIEIVGRLVEQQHVAALEQGLGQVQATALAARQRADQFLLVRALEVEAADVGARLDLDAVDVEDVGTARDFLEHVVVALELLAALVDVGDLDRLADADFAGIGLFLADDHLEQGRLAGTIRADDADDRAGRHDQAEVVDQQAVTEGLADVLEFHDRGAEALAGRNEDLVGFIATLVVDRLQLLDPGQARLALAATALGIAARPFELALDRLLARLLARFFLLEALVLLLEPRGVVALPRNAAAAIEFEDPLGGVVEEVAVMGDRDHGAREVGKEVLEPFNRFGVEMVGRFVEQQHVGFRQQQAAQRDAALLATGELADIGFPRRQAQRVGGDLELALERMRVGHREQVFEALLLGGELVEIGAFLGVGRIDLVEALLRIDDLGHAFFDHFAHGLVGVELRLLFEEADLGARVGSRLALEVGIGAGHDPKHGRFAGAIEAEQADLGAREERKRDVLDDLALRRNDLADADHRVDVLHANSGIGSIPTRPGGQGRRSGKRGLRIIADPGAGRHVLGGMGNREWGMVEKPIFGRTARFCSIYSPFPIPHSRLRASPAARAIRPGWS